MSYKFNGHDITDLFNPGTSQPPGGNAVTVFGANSDYFKYNGSSDIIGSNASASTNTSDDYMGTNNDNYGNELPYTVNTDSTNIGNYLMVSHNGFSHGNNNTYKLEGTNANRIRVVLVGGGGGHGGSGGNAKAKITASNHAEGHGGRGGYGGIGARIVHKLSRNDVKDIDGKHKFDNVMLTIGGAGAHGSPGNNAENNANAGFVTKAHGKDGNAGSNGSVTSLTWTDLDGETTEANASGGAGGGGGKGASAETKTNSNTHSTQGVPGTDRMSPSTNTNYNIFTSQSNANTFIQQTVQSLYPNFSTKWTGKQSSETWLTYGGGGYQISNGNTRNTVDGNEGIDGKNGYAIVVYLYD
jgi:hypothetical protein